MPHRSRFPPEASRCALQHAPALRPCQGRAGGLVLTGGSGSGPGPRLHLGDPAERAGLVAGVEHGEAAVRVGADLTCRSISGDPAGIRSTQSAPSWSSEAGRRRSRTGRRRVAGPPRPWTPTTTLRAARATWRAAVLLGDAPSAAASPRRLGSPSGPDADRVGPGAVGVVADVGVDALGAQGLLEAGGVVEPVHGDDDVAVPVELHGVRRRGAAVTAEADDPDDAGGQTCGDRADGEPADPAATRALVARPAGRAARRRGCAARRAARTRTSPVVCGSWENLHLKGRE